MERGAVVPRTVRWIDQSVVRWPNQTATRLLGNGIFSNARCKGTGVLVAAAKEAMVVASVTVCDGGSAAATLMRRFACLTCHVFLIRI